MNDINRLEKSIRLIARLRDDRVLSKEEFVFLIENRTAESAGYLFEEAAKIREKNYGNGIYIRGLIEFTSYCKNDCFYCGLRRSNQCAERYRLTKEQIMQCCENGYALGFRTFVLQGGEDPYFKDEIISDIIRSIKRSFPDCAVTLSIGEKSKESYRAYRNAGADRYLLRHETADNSHYAMLHPHSLSADNRKKCLFDLKELGFQTGSGFMVGSPYQTSENLADDMLFLKKLEPHMVGIGPFIPHSDTPFGDRPAGSAELTLFMTGLLRLMLPCALIPATTALGTVDPNGRERAVLAGANVVMPNLSPGNVRRKYLLYNNKICTGDEAAEHIKKLERRFERIGCKISYTRGDCVSIQNRNQNKE